MIDVLAMHEELRRVEKIDPRRLWRADEAIGRLLLVLAMGGLPVRPVEWPRSRYLQPRSFNATSGSAGLRQAPSTSACSNSKRGPLEAKVM